MSDAVLARRAASLLRLVASSAEPIGLSDLARTSAIPKATCVRILRALVDEQLIEIEPDTRRYRVSFSLIALMADRVHADGSFDLLAAEVGRLSEVTSETAGVDILVGSEVAVVLQVEGPLLISQTRTQVPRRLPLLTTSTGKAFLAWHTDPAFVDAQLDTVDQTDRIRLLDDFARSRDRGYSLAWEELHPGAAAIAAPVQIDGHVVCTVWIGGPSFRLTPEQIPILGVHVVDAADRLSTLLRTGRASLADLAMTPTA
ncbi:MAG: IclR family transcriptional regulator [Acidimicrobiales bacterium]